MRENILSRIILIVLALVLFPCQTNAQENIDGRRILIIGSVYQHDDTIYRGDKTMAVKQFTEAARRVLKFGTPVLITDYLLEEDYFPKNWVIVFKQWIELAKSCQECYIVPCERDGMMEWLIPHLTMKIPIETNKQITWETPKLLLNEIPRIYPLLFELDTTDVVYYNTTRSRSAYKNDCPAGYTGSKVTYYVYAKRFCSVISQAFVDNYAISVAEENKQGYANLKGTCYPQIYYNTKCTRTVTKKDCPEGFYGTKVQYVVPAKKYSSVVSQADAQSKAVAEAEANKQLYANQIGTCIKIISP